MAIIGRVTLAKQQSQTTPDVSLPAVKPAWSSPDPILAANPTKIAPPQPVFGVPTKVPTPLPANDTAQTTDQQTTHTTVEALKNAPVMLGRIGKALVQGTGRVGVAAGTFAGAYAMGKTPGEAMRTAITPTEPGIKAFTGEGPISGQAEGTDVLKSWGVPANLAEKYGPAFLLASFGSNVVTGGMAHSLILGSMAIPKTAARIIADTTDTGLILKTLTKEIPEISTRFSPKQVDMLTTLLRDIKDPAIVQSVISKADFATNGVKTGEAAADTSKPAVGRVAAAREAGVVPAGAPATPKLFNTPPPVTGRIQAATAIPTVQPKTAEEAVQRYKAAVIDPAIQNRQTIVLGADDMKDHFGKDYNDANHPIYSKATFHLFEKLVPESKSDTVLLTGGGAGAGKTDFLVKPVVRSGFDGVLYDSNFSSLEGARNQLKIIRDSGKTPLIRGILPNLDVARTHTILRGNETGRYVSDNTFARGHAGFPNTIKALLESGELSPAEVELYDFRHVKTVDEITKIVNLGIYTKDPLALVKKLAYNEDNVRQQYSAVNYSPETGRRHANPGDNPGDRHLPHPERTDTSPQPAPNRGGIRPEPRSNNDTSGASAVRSNDKRSSSAKVTPPTTSLHKEALKYKSAEEFRQKVKGGTTQYGDYNPGLRADLPAGYTKISELGINPEEMVTIYRGVDDLTGKVKRKINDGDFVTTDFDSALSYTGNPKDVVEMQVPAKYLYNSEPRDFKDEPFYIGAEYVYTTKDTKPLPTDKELTDIYNQAHAEKPVPKPKPTPAAVDTLDQIAQQDAGGEYALARSAVKDQLIEHNLTSVFADLKGVSVADVTLKFSERDLEKAHLQYDFIDEAIRNDPAGALVKFMSRSTGRLPEITGKTTKLSSRGGTSPAEVKNGVYGRQGDDINQTVFGRVLEPGEAQDLLTKHLEMVAARKDFETKLSAIKHNIRLAKAKDVFVGKEKTRLARELATNLASLNKIVKAAERAGFRRGLKQGSEKVAVLINRNKMRRLSLQRIKVEYNLTDTEWRTIRRQPQERVVKGEKQIIHRDLDWRELDSAEFKTYVADVSARAANQNEKNKEKVIINAIITEKDLKRVENLQKAMEFPSVPHMTLAQLQQFSDALAKVEFGGEFLTARMIQTTANTDLGSTKTVGEALAKVAAQNPEMKITPVMGKGIDNWLRLPTLASRDPLHKMFITDWTGDMVEMLNIKHQVEHTLNTLKKAANQSRRQANRQLRKQGRLKQTVRARIFAALVPEDRLVAQWLQPYHAEYANNTKTITVDPEIRARAEKQMTPEEIAYAKHAEALLSGIYEAIEKEALVRWTLRGVKHSNYRGEEIKSVYLPHSTRSRLEIWRDDGFFSMLRRTFGKEVQESKIDFNAYGDRGQVLGFEKWFKNNSTREGEGFNNETGQFFYSLNTTKTVMKYYAAMQKKLVIDNLIPKVKLYEYLLGKRLQTPASIGAPEGSMEVNSELHSHLNMILNVFKGQKAGGFLKQGGSAEGVLNTLRVWIAIKSLGLYLPAQLISGAGAQVVTYTAIGSKAFAKGHVRIFTKQGKKLVDTYAGVVGSSPWSELGRASNEAGDIARSALFYGFGDLQYRAMRQMFLGSLTTAEFTSGVVSKARQTQIRLRMGEFHPLPGDESVYGRTAEAKMANLFTGWAYPIIQTTYFKNIPRLRAMIATTPLKEWKTVANSDEFQTLFRTVIVGAGTAVLAYTVLQPDPNDHSSAGYLRTKAAQEISSVIQSITMWGLPLPGSILLGYIDHLRIALVSLATMDTYKDSGPGYKKGDLRGPDLLAKAVLPNVIPKITDLIAGQPATPARTKADIKADLAAKLASGELSPAAAQVWLAKEVATLKAADAARRLTLPKAEFKAALKKGLADKSITDAEVAKEIKQYIKNEKEYSPENFVGGTDATFIGKIKIAATAVFTDPVTLFEAIFTDEQIRRMDNGEIILYRGKSTTDQGQRDFATAERKKRGATAALRLDHRIPLQIGGDNSAGNLWLVPTKEWERFTPVENYLGQALREGRIDGTKAQTLITAFKANKMTDQEVYAAVR